MTGDHTQVILPMAALKIPQDLLVTPWLHTAHLLAAARTCQSHDEASE